ncbi:MAG: hypothetical protein FJ146_16460 [Deltaproteobacteria bacterium]|nr:hypothetical protein [Deltaproteobacteria bacterium]
MKASQFKPTSEDIELAKAALRRISPQEGGPAETGPYDVEQAFAMRVTGMIYYVPDDPTRFRSMTRGRRHESQSEPLPKIRQVASGICKYPICSFVNASGDTFTCGSLLFLF